MQTQYQSTTNMAFDNNLPHAVPPHPRLRRKLIKEFETLKKGLKTTLLENKLSFQKRPLAGLDDSLIKPGNSFELGTPLGVAKSPASAPPLLRGKVNVLVVLVDFPGTKMTKSNQHFNDLFFSKGKIPTGSVTEYYNEVSNGLVDLQGTVIGPFTLPNAINHYANNQHGMSAASPNMRDMASDTFAAMPSGFNLDMYDNNKDGYVDAFVIVHAGPGAEETGEVNDLWSVKWVKSGPAVPQNAVTKVYGFLTVPENCKIGVCAHELGHLVFGFPDLYDGSDRSNGIGDWCLMASGSWNNSGHTPAHPNAWCKMLQGWVKTTVPKTNQKQVAIEDVKKGFTVFKLWKKGNTGTEYFLIENRRQEGFDNFIPGNGLLIWHVDETMEGNDLSQQPHYKIALMQADGKRNLESTPKAGNSGDDGDPFPGMAINRNFNAVSNPNSLSYGGILSAVAVENIKQSGKSVVADISVI